MDYFDPKATDMPKCPNLPQITEVFPYPLIAWVYMLLALCSLAFSTVTGMKYNSVPVYIEKGKVSNTETVRKNGVSNTLWIVYFLTVACSFFILPILRPLPLMFLECAQTSSLVVLLPCLRFLFTLFLLMTGAVIDALGFSLYEITELKSFDLGFVLASLILGGGTAMFLTLALNHQFRHRSAFKKKSPEQPDVNTSTKRDSLGPKQKSVRKKIQKILLGIETPIIILFLLYMASIYALFQTNEDTKDATYFYVYISLYTIQRVPSLILLLLIIAKSDATEGPTIGSRIVLAIGVAINLAGEIPLSLWSLILTPAHDECFFTAFSPLDIINFAFVLSQFFLFVFLRAEFIRNKEHCVWTIVSKRTDFFDFREFGDTSTDEFHGTSTFYA